MNVGHPRQDRRGAALNAQFHSLSSSDPATKWASVSGVNNVLQANANLNPSSNPDGVHGNGSFSTEPGLRQLSPLYDASKPPTQGYKPPAIPYAEDPSGAQHVHNEARSERWLQEQDAADANRQMSTAALVADQDEAIRQQRQALQDHRDQALASLEAERVSMQAEIDAKMAENVKLSSELWSASVPPKSANSPLSPSAQHSSDGDNTPARVSPMPPPPADDASPGASDGGAGVLPTADASGTINVAELVADLDFDLTENGVDRAPVTTADGPTTLPARPDDSFINRPPSRPEPHYNELMVTMAQSLTELLQQSVSSDSRHRRTAIEQTEVLRRLCDDTIHTSQRNNAGMADLLSRFITVKPEPVTEVRAPTSTKPYNALHGVRDLSITECEILVTSLDMGTTDKWVEEFGDFISLKHTVIAELLDRDVDETAEGDGTVEAYIARAFLLCLNRAAARVKEFLMQVRLAKKAGLPTTSGRWLLKSAIKFSSPQKESDLKQLRKMFDDTTYFVIGMLESEFMLAVGKLLDDFHLTDRNTDKPDYLHYAILSKVPVTNTIVNRFLNSMAHHFYECDKGFSHLIPYDEFVAQLCFKVCSEMSDDTVADGLFNDHGATAMAADECFECDPGDSYDDPIDSSPSASWASKGKASQPRSMGLSNSSNLSSPPPKRMCWNCGRWMPECHSFGKGNCDRVCGWDKPGQGCGHGFCPGNRGLPCVVRRKQSFKYPDVLNGADPPMPLPERMVQVLLDSQAVFLKAKRVADVAMFAEFYGVDEEAAAATLDAELGNDE